MSAAISRGALFGFINGMVITRLEVPDLIGTLTMDLVCRGLCPIAFKGIVLSRFPEPIVAIGRGDIPGFLRLPVVIALLALAAGWFIITRTHLGRYALAVGSNPEAAELAGVPVDSTRVRVYVLMRAMAGLAGVMLAGKLNPVQAMSAPFFKLHVIAAVVVGGTSLFGGRGSMLGSLCGVLLSAMMINALVTLRIEFFWQSVASGAVIILSVAFYTWLQRKNRDGESNWIGSLRKPQNIRMLRLLGVILAILIAIFGLGAVLTGPVPT